MNDGLAADLAAPPDLGVAPISLSKYRVGIGLLDLGRRAQPQPGSELFA
jgi:hypothetical protein